MVFDINKVLNDAIQHHKETENPTITIFFAFPGSDSNPEPIEYDARNITLRFNENLPGDAVFIEKFGEVDVSEGFVMGFVLGKIND